MSRFSILLCAVLLLASTVRGQHVRISKSPDAKVTVDASALRTTGGAAIAMRKALLDDISRSGWMGLGAPGQATILLKGAATDANGQLRFECQATDAAGTAYINGTYSVPPAQALELAHQVAHDLVTKVTGKPTYFLSKLAMLGTANGARELYIADSSAQNRRQITHDRAGAIRPRWSPDNRSITYTSFIKHYPDVYSIDLANSTRSCVASYPGVNSGGAISPDGRSRALILSKDGNPDLYIQDIATRRLTRLTYTPRAVEGSPEWSPDGTRLVFVSDSSGTPQLYILPRSGGNPVRLTTTGAQNVAPDWGANNLIACQTLLGGKFQISVIDPATKQSRIITDLAAAYEEPSWAPDGRHIAAARAVNYQYSVYLLDTMGDKPVALTTSGDWRAPAWQH